MSDDRDKCSLRSSAIGSKVGEEHDDFQFFRSILSLGMRSKHNTQSIGIISSSQFEFTMEKHIY